MTRSQYFILASYLLVVVGFASCWRQAGVDETQQADGRAQVSAGGQEHGVNEEQ